jgi:hypothetical protein
MPQRLIVVLTAVNVAASVSVLAAMRAARADAPAAVLRGRALEILDAEGRVRASVSVLPAGTSAAGDPHPETVLLRLITEQGRPSVKISASEEAAGMSLAGPTGTKDTYVILEAKGRESSLRLRNEGGAERAVDR